MLQTKNTPTENITFVDGITKRVYDPDNKEDCYFIDPEMALNELSESIKKSLDHGCDCLIFDSITNLFAYNKKASVEYFVQNLASMLEERNCKGIFISLKNSGASNCCPILTTSNVEKEHDLFDVRISERMNIIEVDDK